MSAEAFFSDNSSNKGNVLLIDENKERMHQFEAIFSFLEYSVDVQTYQILENNFQQCDHADLVFIGYGERHGAVVQAAIENLPQSRLFLLIEKNKSNQVSSSIYKTVHKVLEWPTSQHIISQFLTPKDFPSHHSTLSAGKTVSQKGLAGNSKNIRQTRRLIEQVACSDATVLILGESGTGKEVVAQAIHKESLRKDKPFVPVNCGAIPGELLESELFGHEKGAFTGALSARQGRFEMAEGGTLFLDEIGDMPMPMQVKLLRVLQERTFERVGSNKTIDCDVRVIAATHRDLEGAIEENKFREDLFYRLNVFPIELSALRERIEDIPYLVQHIISRMKRQGRGNVSLNNQVVGLLMQHNWPGNIRELANLIERLAILYPDGQVDVAGLPEKFQGYDVPEGFQIAEVVPEIKGEPISNSVEKIQVSVDTTASEAVQVLPNIPTQGLDLKEYLSDLESGLIKQALDECNGVVAHAAKKLNMRRTTLVEKLRKYELN